jgi:hypothetical protein
MKSTSNIIVNRIKRNVIIKQFLMLSCVLVIILGLTTFVIYALNNKNNAVKFISKGNEKNLKVEKVMVNPEIKFEHSEDNFYDITAKKAIHIDDNNIELFDVTAVGAAGNIKAGRLLVSNNGNNLYFSDNPVLTIIQNKNEQ